MNVEISHRIVDFSCSSCGAAWSEDYEVRHVEDSEGGIWEHFRVNDAPGTSPLARLSCRSCHQPTVSIVTPTGHRVSDVEDRP